MSSYQAKMSLIRLMKHAEEVAEQTYDGMTEEECIDMVRTFATWVKTILPGTDLNDPIGTGIHCLSTAMLFPLAFGKAYYHMEDRLDAINAIEEAFES